MTLTIQLQASATYFDGGVDAYAGVGAQTLFDFGGTWIQGDKWMVTLTDNQTGIVTQVGAGDVTGQLITPYGFVMTFNNREYLLSGPVAYFSALEQPTVWNDPNGIGNGFIEMSNYDGAPEALVAAAHYQGRLAFLSRKYIQIWTVDADPTLFVKNQTLTNIGTFAPLSVQSVGDLEVIFLHDTGIRSLRARDSSLNAFTEDVGSAIDMTVRAKVYTASATERLGACGTVEPTTNSYWCFIKDMLYVLSYYRNNKVVAWSTYAPTYRDSNGVQTAFVPQKFVTFNGLVYARASDSIYIYGGADGTEYDNCIATVETPWLDAKAPSTMKQGQSLAVVATMGWKYSSGMDPYSGTLEQVLFQYGPMLDIGKASFEQIGTHFRLRAVSEATQATAFTNAGGYASTALAYSWATGNSVLFTTTGALPTGISVGTVYFLSAATTTAWGVYPTRADALAGTNRITLVGAGTGAHTMTVRLDQRATISSLIFSFNDTKTDSL